MTKRLEFASLAAMSVLLCACGSDALIQSASPLDQAFDDVMSRYQLPGLAVGVIENGEVVYTRTAGELVADSGDDVTSDTLFKIASNSKAMTASVLARLVEARKLHWDDPVTKHLPGFRMYDPWVTRNMQVRDLLVHNSGLPEGGGDLMLWPEPNDFTRADIIAGLAYLKPAYSFRSGYAYDNLLYVVAGEVAAAAGGSTYEDLVRREVFEPLGLDCRVGQWQSDTVDNVAQPHMRVEGQNVPVRADQAIVPAITSAAAGGIRCSLDAMLAWARNWLAPNADQLAWLSIEQRRAMWTPRTPMPISDRRRAWNDTHYYAYAFGFRLADANGAWTVSHTGTLMGMYSAMTLLPDQRSGLVLLTNGEAGEARTVLNEVLLKFFTAPEERKTVAYFAEQLALERASPERPRVPDTTARRPATPEQMKAVTGIWRDPWFGEVSICARGDSVRFEAAKSPMLTGTVMHVGSRYLVDWDADSVDVEPWLDFSHGGDGTAPALAMAKVDPDGDFSFDYEDLAFSRDRDCAKSNDVPVAATDTRMSDIDSIMQAYRGEVPGASVLVLQDGAAAVRRSFGLADVERHIAAAPDTNYRLASVAKQFTAAAILLLIEDGVVGLDDRAGKWLPSLPESDDDITIRHLLTHTSGLIDYEEIMPADLSSQLRDADVLALLEQESGLYFEPGTAWRYSNGGYALLALIVERASGQSFQSFLRERIFVPLGMDNTLAYVQEGPPVPNRAYGYSEIKGEWKRTDQSLTSAVLGDGGVYSSIDDLAKWDAALYDDRLLRDESRTLAFTPWTGSDDPDVDYGFGWRITGDTLWHSGETIGFRNVIVRWPEQRLTVVILTNRNGPEPYGMALKIADRFLPPKE